MSRDLHPVLSPERDYQPEKWTSRHRACVALEISGMKPKAIAERLGYTVSRVSIILSDPRAALDRRELAKGITDRLTDVQMKLQVASHEAVDELIDELRNSADEKVRHKAANSILDRAGYSTIRREVKPAPEIPDELGDRMAEVMEEMENIQEADYEVLDPEIDEEAFNELEG